MHAILTILFYIALAGTAITLLMGVGVMFKNKAKGEKDSSNKLMQLRILFQGAALILLSLLLFTSKP